jgi:hypothetical protein
MLRLVDGWCGEALDEEYAELTRRVIGRLARKRRSPLVRGDPRVWAAGERAMLRLRGRPGHGTDKQPSPPAVSLRCPPA